MLQCQYSLIKCIYITLPIEVVDKILIQVFLEFSL